MTRNNPGEQFSYWDRDDLYDNDEARKSFWVTLVLLHEFFTVEQLLERAYQQGRHDEYTDPYDSWGEDA